MNMNCKERIPDLPEDGFKSDEAAREFGRQLAMDALLTRLPEASAEEPRNVTVAFPSIVRLAAMAAVLMIGVMVLTFLNIEKWTPKAPSWAVEAKGDVEYSELAPYHLKLERGELLVPAASNEQSVVIDTTIAIVNATGAQFTIEAALEPSPNPQPFEDEVQITRIRVQSGVVTLITPEGSVEGTTGDVLFVAEGMAPKNLGPETTLQKK